MKNEEQEQRINQWQPRIPAGLAGCLAGVETLTGRRSISAQEVEHCESNATDALVQAEGRRDRKMAKKIMSVVNQEQDDERQTLMAGLLASRVVNQEQACEKLDSEKAPLLKEIKTAIQLYEEAACTPAQKEDLASTKEMFKKLQKKVEVCETLKKLKTLKSKADTDLDNLKKIQTDNVKRRFTQYIDMLRIRDLDTTTLERWQPMMLLGLMYDRMIGVPRICHSNASLHELHQNMHIELHCKLLKAQTTAAISLAEKVDPQCLPKLKRIENAISSLEPSSPNGLKEPRPSSPHDVKKGLQEMRVNLTGVINRVTKDSWEKTKKQLLQDIKQLLDLPEEKIEMVNPKDPTSSIWISKSTVMKAAKQNVDMVDVTVDGKLKLATYEVDMVDGKKLKTEDVSRTGVKKVELDTDTKAALWLRSAEDVIHKMTVKLWEQLEKRKTPKERDLEEECPKEQLLRKMIAKRIDQVSAITSSEAKWIDTVESYRSTIMDEKDRRRIGEVIERIKNKYPDVSTKEWLKEVKGQFETGDLKDANHKEAQDFRDLGFPAEGSRGPELPILTHIELQSVVRRLYDEAPLVWKWEVERTYGIGDAEVKSPPAHSQALHSEDDVTNVTNVSNVTNGTNGTDTNMTLTGPSSAKTEQHTVTQTVTKQSKQAGTKTVTKQSKQAGTKTVTKHQSRSLSTNSTAC
eukprot:GHVO01042700.1.p1 GENE.GHVO01042700.1~~GHVO01042700.1.p1  ORF type:complete len:689 (-),score=92.16 GHVO01042700.1:122-2188(-)